MNKIHIFKSQLLQLCLFIYFVISAKHTYIYTNKSIKQLLIGSYSIQHKLYSHFTFDFCNIVHKTKSNKVIKSKFLFLFWSFQFLFLLILDSIKWNENNAHNSFIVGISVGFTQFRMFQFWPEIARIQTRSEKERAKFWRRLQCAFRVFSGAAYTKINSHSIVSVLKFNLIGYILTLWRESLAFVLEYFNPCFFKRHIITRFLCSFCMRF